MFGWGKKNAPVQTPAPPPAKPAASAKPAAATNGTAKPAASSSNSAAAEKSASISTAAPSRLESTHSSCSESSTDMVEGSGAPIERSESYERALKMAYRPPKDSMVVIPASSAAQSTIDPSFYTHMATYAPTTLGVARSSFIAKEAFIAKAPPKTVAAPPPAKPPPQVKVPADSPSPQKPSPPQSPSPNSILRKTSSNEDDREFAEARAQIAKAKSHGRASFSARSEGSEADDGDSFKVSDLPLKVRLEKLEKEHAALKEEVATLRAERAADRAWMEERLKQATALQRRPSRLPGSMVAAAPAPAPAAAGMPNPRAFAGVSARKASAAATTLSSPRNSDSPVHSAMQTFSRSAKNLLFGVESQTEQERASVKV